MAVACFRITLVASIFIFLAECVKTSSTDPIIVIPTTYEVTNTNETSVTLSRDGRTHRCMTGSLTATAATAGGAAARRTFRRSNKHSGWLCGCSRGGSGIPGLRALSFLPPAVAPQRATGAVVVTRPLSVETKRLESTPRPIIERDKCRPAVRSPPLRLSLSKPSSSKSASSKPGRSTARPTAGASGTGGETLEMGCGGVEGGMTSTLTWMESVNSTMDEAKTLVVKQQGSGANGVFGVAAREQLKGRGTKGRAWVGLPGNVFLTVAIPLERVPVPLSLIPLRVGTLIAPEIQRTLQQRPTPAAPGGREPAQPGVVLPQPRVSLKWPNDVLLDGDKVAGVLIEAELPFLLVGIGVNVRNKPDVHQQGPDRGRPAACLAEYGGDSTDQAVRALSATLTDKLCSWASGKDSAELALAEWSRWVDWTLPLQIRDEGRVVRPVGVAPDGCLRVVDPDTGREELLTTEYLL
ncbi:unnamed protein product [Ascophyllum nodosum]